MADKFGSRKRGPYRSKLFEELSPPVKSQSQSETDQPSSHHAVMRRLREKIASRNDFQEGRVASQANEKMTTSGISKTQPTEANNQEDNEALWTNIELSNRMEEDHEIHIQDREELETFEPDDFMLSFDLPDDIPNISNNTDNNTDDDDDIPLYEGANVSVGAFMLVLALFASKQNLVGDGIEQLLKIFSFVLPEGNKVVTTLYSFKSYFRKLKNKLQFHYYCPKCLSNIEINYCQCQNGACGKTFDRQSLPYFIEIPIIQQLENLFLQKGFYQTLQGRFNRSTSKNQFSDIYDGQIYKQMSCNNGPLNNPDNISFILNTDGAPVFKSSGVSIWPLFLTLNELDIKHRMKPENLILSGLWFGTKKPTMCTFLKPFVSSMKQLCRGVQLFSPERGFFVCKAFLLAATADLPAKALLCNSVQYNGSYGCWHCLQKGETAHRGKGHVHVFPFKKELPKGPERTVTNVLQNAQTVLNSGKVKSVNGVKGPSWLTFCPKFDIVHGLCIDYMHGVLLGVQKLLLKLWFSKEFSAEKFSVAKCLPKVDQRLLAIQPTLNINRIPRSIQDEIKYWKASEFKFFCCIMVFLFLLIF